MEGYIKLHRKILENPIACKDSDYFSIWVYLLLNATHKEYDVLFKGKKVSLKPGELLTGRKSISAKLKISESKVQRILKDLESEQQIEQQTSNQNRLISILNWEKYQHCEQQTEQQVNNEWTTSEQQVNTNKNVKNDNNVKNVKKDTPTKHKFGEFKHVLLTDNELIKLKNTYKNADELITYLDEYIEMKGYKAKSHYMAIKKWVVSAVERNGNYNKQTESKSVGFMDS